MLDNVEHQARPGELLAVARALFIAAAISETLRVENCPAIEIVVKASCTFAGPLPHRELQSLVFDVSGRVPELDDAGFRRFVEAARERSLRATGTRQDLPGELNARLEPPV